MDASGHQIEIAASRKNSSLPTPLQNETNECSCVPACSPPVSSVNELFPGKHAFVQAFSAAISNPLTSLGLTSGDGNGKFDPSFIKRRGAGLNRWLNECLQLPAVVEACGRRRRRGHQQQRQQRATLARGSSDDVDGETDAGIRTAQAVRSFLSMTPEDMSMPENADTVAARKQRRHQREQRDRQRQKRRKKNKQRTGERDSATFITSVDGDAKYFEGVSRGATGASCDSDSDGYGSDAIAAGENKNATAAAMVRRLTAKEMIHPSLFPVPGLVDGERVAAGTQTFTQQEVPRGSSALARSSAMTTTGTKADSSTQLRRRYSAAAEAAAERAKERAHKREKSSYEGLGGDAVRIHLPVTSAVVTASLNNVEREDSATAQAQREGEDKGARRDKQRAQGRNKSRDRAPRSTSMNGSASSNTGVRTPSTPSSFFSSIAPRTIGRIRIDNGEVHILSEERSKSSGPAYNRRDGNDEPFFSRRKASSTDAEQGYRTVRGRKSKNHQTSSQSSSQPSSFSPQAAAFSPSSASASSSSVQSSNFTPSPSPFQSSSSSYNYDELLASGFRLLGEVFELEDLGPIRGNLYLVVRGFFKFWSVLGVGSLAGTGYLSDMFEKAETAASVAWVLAWLKDLLWPSAQANAKFKNDNLEKTYNETHENNDFGGEVAAAMGVEVEKKPVERRSGKNLKAPTPIPVTDREFFTAGAARSAFEMERDRRWLRRELPRAMPESVTPVLGGSSKSRKGLQKVADFLQVCMEFGIP